MQTLANKVSVSNAGRLRPEPWSPVKKEPEPAAKPMCFGDLVRQQAEQQRAEILSRVTGIGSSGETHYVEKWIDRKAQRQAAQPIIVSPVVRVDRAGRLNKASRDRLLIAYKNGEPMERIVKRFKVSAMAARNIARRAGLPPRRGGWPSHPPALVRAVRQARGNGMIIHKICEKHGLSHSQVCRMCRSIKRQRRRSQ